MAGKKRLWDQTSDVRRNAQTRLPELTRAWIAEGNGLTGGALVPAAMHRFRLHTKSLRYTLELFRPCYGPGLDRRLAVLRQLQNLLGAISDCQTIRDFVASYLADDDPERKRIEALLTSRSKRKCAEFRSSWKRTFAQPERQRLWLQYLARPRHPR
jgi:CHAD domain-containing protein